MTLLEVMPTLNASLNALSGILLFSGFVQIRRKNILAHRRLMLSACATSTLFLVCYVLHHILRAGVVTRFTGTGAIRTLYFSILLSHTVLAVVVLPLAIVTVLHGLNSRVEKHRRIARWTFPVWMYVSITGVLVYFFLYHWFPAA